MALYAIYIGKKAEPNLDIGLNNGIWGFKRKPRRFDRLRKGDTVYLCHKAKWLNNWGERPKGYPRTKEGQFRARINIIEVKLTSDPFETDQPKIWNDETYRYRFNFITINKHYSVELSPEQHPSLTEAIRYSATTYGWVESVKSAESLLQREDIPLSEENDQEGWVYALNHPKWPNWTKIGCTIDHKARLNNYHTSVPDRSHDYIWKERAVLAYQSEQKILKYLRNYCDDHHIPHSHEWFELNLDAEKLSSLAHKLGIVDKY